MRRVRGVAWLGVELAAVVVVLLGTATVASAQQGDAKAQFDRLCAACHGKTGAGDGAAAAALKAKPPNFTDAKFQAARTDDSLKAVIVKGKAPMPPFGKQLSSAQIGALVGYIRSFAQKPKQP